MKRTLAIAVVLLGCGKKDTSRPPADAAPQRADAVVADAAEIDAVAAAKPTVKKLVASGHATCAVLTDKTLRCWGANPNGELGDGSQQDAPTPVTPKLKGIEDVAFGDAHACALLDDGSVACWGRIGIGKKQLSLDPTAVPGVTNAMHVFAKGAAGCATVADDSMVCWGDVTAKGRIRARDGTSQRTLASGADGGALESRVPTPVVGLDHVVALSANGALRGDGGVYYIGEDGEPVRTAIANATEIASTGKTLCAKLDSGIVQCVGPKPLCAEVPKTVKAAPKKPSKPAKVVKGKKPPPKTGKPPPPKPEKVEMALEIVKLPLARHLAFEAGGVCVITTAGRLQCLDRTNACKLDAPWPELAKLDTISEHCAHTTDGAVKCWNVDGKKRVTTTIAGAAGASMIAAGANYGCALVEDRVGCWGKNDHGELGRGAADGDPHPEAAPVKLP